MAQNQAPERAPEGVPVPGEPTSLKSKLLDTGTGTLQSFKPVNKICQHVCAFHCYAHDTERQVVAHHYCSHLNEEVRQCVIYDSPGPEARLIGVEYIISQALFEALPDEEKRFWHSHWYEVTSGQLLAPGVPLLAQNQDAQKLVTSYGKTWHFWQVDRGDPLPYGPPQLMASFTADGQLDPRLMAARDAEFGVDSRAVRDSRADLAASAPPPHAAADECWRRGRTLQAQMQEVKVRNHVPRAGASGAEPGTEAATGARSVGVTPE